MVLSFIISFNETTNHPNRPLRVCSHRICSRSLSGSRRMSGYAHLEHLSTSTRYNNRRKWSNTDTGGQPRNFSRDYCTKPGA
jgi:hypothetical protein